MPWWVAEITLLFQCHWFYGFVRLTKWASYPINMVEIVIVAVERNYVKDSDTPFLTSIFLVIYCTLNAEDGYHTLNFSIMNIVCLMHVVTHCSSHYTKPLYPCFFYGAYALYLTSNCRAEDNSYGARRYRFSSIYIYNASNCDPSLKHNQILVFEVMWSCATSLP